MCFVFYPCWQTKHSALITQCTDTHVVLFEPNYHFTHLSSQTAKNSRKNNLSSSLQPIQTVAERCIPATRWTRFECVKQPYHGWRAKCKMKSSSVHQTTSVPVVASGPLLTLTKAFLWSEQFSECQPASCLSVSTSLKADSPYRLVFYIRTPLPQRRLVISLRPTVLVIRTVS